MWIQLAPPLAVVAVPLALSMPRGRIAAPIALALLTGAAAPVSVTAALVTLSFGVAAGALFALARATGAPAHGAMLAVGLVALALFGSLFLLGPAIEGALERGAAFESIRPAVQLVLDVHPYTAISVAEGRDPLQSGALYETLGAYRLLPPRPNRAVVLPLAFAAACAALAACAHWWRHPRA